jgi:hypothetical protein
MPEAVAVHHTAVLEALVARAAADVATMAATGLAAQVAPI